MVTKILSNFQRILCIVPLALAFSKQTPACDMRIGNCDYKLTLVPSSQCNGSNFQRSRSKRSEVTEYSIGDVMGEMTTIHSNFEKLEKKLVKEMKNLSTRVLRAARRLETKDTGSETKGHKRRRTDCPTGYVTFGDLKSCYVFSTFTATWYDARDYCVAMGSDLVSLESIQEHLLVAFRIQNTADYRTAEGWWTSGTKIAGIDKWLWSSNGGNSLFTYMKWAVNEPNDMKDQKLPCVMMYKLDGLLWHDQACTDKYNFVCEKLIG